jgi:hypothetical protein
MSLKGQWIGNYNGPAEGILFLNIDDAGSHYEGSVSILPFGNDIPSAFLRLTTTNKACKQVVTANPVVIHPRTRQLVSWDDIKNLYDEDVTFAESVIIHLSLKDGKIHIEAQGSNGVFSSVLNAADATTESSVVGEKMSWQEFKNRLANISKTKYLFRGQTRPWRLCTSFHRGGRYRISEFIAKDVKKLHQRLSGITNHYFDLNNPEQNGAFYSLLQHHGYPTPLLDWSYSPYVAAFFAFRGVQKHQKTGKDDVRVYLFDHEQWKAKFNQSHVLDPPLPHLSVMEFISIANPRQIPQQAATTATNVLDIESYIKQLEKTKNAAFLTAIDIPASERDAAMDDLRFMGITAGSMFPGIDGVCEELRERNFN